MKTEELLTQMAQSLKVINGEMGGLLKSAKTVKILLIINTLLLSAGIVKFMFFSS